jgi:hypothetical protein
MSWGIGTLTRGSSDRIYVSTRLRFKDRMHPNQIKWNTSTISIGSIPLVDHSIQSWVASVKVISNYRRRKRKLLLVIVRHSLVIAEFAPNKINQSVYCWDYQCRLSLLSLIFLELTVRFSFCEENTIKIKIDVHNRLWLVCKRFICKNVCCSRRYASLGIDIDSWTWIIVIHNKLFI